MKTTTMTTTRAFYFIIALMLFSVLLNAQIKIKERVEISPVTRKTQNLSIASGSKATVHLEFSAGTDKQIRLVGPSSMIYGYGTISSDVRYFDNFYYYDK